MSIKSTLYRLTHPTVSHSESGTWTILYGPDYLTKMEFDNSGKASKAFDKLVAGGCTGAMLIGPSGYNVDDYVNPDYTVAHNIKPLKV